MTRSAESRSGLSFTTLDTHIVSAKQCVFQEKFALRIIAVRKPHASFLSMCAQMPGLVLRQQSIRISVSPVCYGSLSRVRTIQLTRHFSSDLVLLVVEGTGLPLFAADDAIICASGFSSVH